MCKEREFWQCNLSGDWESPGDEWMWRWGWRVSMALPAERISFAWQNATSICVFNQVSCFLPAKAGFPATKSRVWWRKSLLVISDPNFHQVSCLPVGEALEDVLPSAQLAPNKYLMVKWDVFLNRMTHPENRNVLFLHWKKKSSLNYWQSFLFLLIIFAGFQGMLFFF